MGRVARASGPASWSEYLAAFHRDRTGITEAVLEHCHGDATGDTPYQWLIAALDDAASVLDLACGNGPLAHLVPGSWTGVDLSIAELRAATQRGAAPIAQAQAAHLPFASASFDAVVCSMALMLTEPLDATLNEIARVLRRDGRLVALVPTTRPLAWRDRWRYTRLLLALRRRRFEYPNDAALRHLPDLLTRAGFAPHDDQRQRFQLAITDRDTAHRFVASLYLPGMTARRFAATDREAERWIDTALGIPLRRVIARINNPPGDA